MDELRVEIEVKDSLKKKLARSRLKWFSHMWQEEEMENWQRSHAQKVEGKGGEEQRNCDGRTALVKICKEWENKGE